MIPFEQIKAPTQLFISGAYVDAADGQTFDNINPATGNSLGGVARGAKEDIDRAVQAARKVADAGKWAGMSAMDRERLLHRIADAIEAHAEELAMLETYDTGKPIRDSRAIDLPMAMQTFRYYAGWPSKIRGETLPVRGKFLTYTLREPIGVAGQIIPWNFPLFMAAMKLGPALAAGNTVVLKPAEQTPLSALYLARLMTEAGLPEGVVNIVTGIGEEAGEALVKHPGVDKIAFTGSTSVGKHIMRTAADTLKGVSLELGGKSPHILFADADLKSALASIIGGIFYNQGEICIAGSRLFVEQSIHDQVVEMMTEAAKSMKIGDPFDKETTMGSLISEEHQSRVAGYVDIASSEGAKVVYGGKKQQVDGAGYFFEPTVLCGVNNEMRVAREEIFGPVLSIIPFSDEKELIRQANDTTYGLAAGLWTRDIGRAHSMAKALQAGTVYINSYSLLDPAAPFGGYKESGIGREMGEQGIEPYLQNKTVWTSLR